MRTIGRASWLALALAVSGCNSTQVAIDSPADSVTIGSAPTQASVEAGEERTERPRKPKRQLARARAPEIKVAVPSARAPDSEPQTEQEREARRADEQMRKWDGAARRALKTICSGC